jgi:integrating conjugative element protein (TIGR03765 family)
MTARRNFLVLGLAVLAHGLPMTARATSLRVIHDAGGGVPYEQWLAQSRQEDQQPGTGESQWIRFPLRTPGLKPGSLKQTRQWARPQWLTQPLAVVGSDALSRRWLSQHAAVLETMNAKVVVVECPDERAFQALQIAAGALPVAPLVTRWLVDQLKAARATVVPLLITSHGAITQQPHAAIQRPKASASALAQSTQPGPRP